MTRKIKRTKNFDLTLEIRNNEFVRPPREAQRNALLNRTLREFCDDLTALDSTAGDFVRGLDRAFSLEDREQAVLQDHQIMEDWQIPIMKAMAGEVAVSRGDVLEIGFGRGVSASFIQDHRVRSHTVIECNDDVVRRFRHWEKGYATRDIRLVHGKWQDSIADLERFDGILFHTYPLNEDEYLEYASTSVTFAEHFFAVAARHLRKGGVFTYLTNEVDSLSRSHQRSLLRHFSSLKIWVLDDLEVPEDVADLWWANSMVIVSANR